MLDCAEVVVVDEAVFEEDLLVLIACEDDGETVLADAKMRI